MTARVIILPGNGCTNVRRSNWYGFVESQLKKRPDIICEVRMENMPDPYEAKESVWIPFIVDTLKVDENTIVIGHSSGAEAAMRLAENHKLLGLILVAACHTDLGEASERISGYYSRPWLWESIRSNCKWIIQYHSEDDPFIPRSEADYVAENLKSEYTCFTNKSHFFSANEISHIFDDIEDKLLKRC